MSTSAFPQQARKFEIQAFKRPRDLEQLHQSHVAFSGAPLKHPYDRNKVMLLTDPYSTHTAYIEFRIEDIGFVQELSNIVTIDGETLNMARIWIKKNAIAVHCTPFVVREMPRFIG